MQEQKRLSSANAAEDSMVQNSETQGDQQDPMKFMTGHMNYYELIHQARSENEESLQID